MIVVDDDVPVPVDVVAAARVFVVVDFTTIVAIPRPLDKS